MINVSNEYKQIAKSNARTPLAKFVIKETNTTIDEEYLTEGFLEEISYADDILIGNVIAKNLELSLHNYDSIDFHNKEIELYTGLVVDGEDNYIKHGTFIIDSVETDEASDIVKITALDYTIKFNNSFIDTLNWESGGITLLTFAQHVCQQCGLTLATTDFPNATYVLTEKPVFDGFHCRYVIGKIAEIAGCSVYINTSDEVEIKLQNNNEVEEIFVDSVIEMETSDITYRPYNAVVLALADGVEGENVTRRDDESIAEYGERSLIITANEFCINEDVRTVLIEAIFNNINGFYYTPIKIKYNVYDWLERTDKIKIYYDDENYFETIVLNQTIYFPKAIDSTIENESLSITNTEYENVPVEDQKRNHTEIVVNKLDSKITATVEIIDEQGESISQLEIDNEGLQSQVSTTITDVNDLQEQLTKVQTTILEQTNEAFTMWFEQTGLQGTLDTVQKELDSNTSDLNKITEYIKFEGAEITLGRSDSQTKLVIKNDRISFMTGTTESAYISENTLYITDSTILNKMQIGHWETKEDELGNLNTKWAGEY